MIKILLLLLLTFNGAHGCCRRGGYAGNLCQRIKDSMFGPVGVHPEITLPASIVYRYGHSDDLTRYVQTKMDKLGIDDPDLLRRAENVQGEAREILVLNYSVSIMESVIDDDGDVYRNSMSGAVSSFVISGLALWVGYDLANGDG